MRGAWRILRVSVVALILSAGPVAAQSTTSALTGTVRNADGKEVRDAVVLARSEDTGATRTGITDERGVYSIELLSPGYWTVVARFGDGLASESRQIRLVLNRTHRVDLVMGRGLTESIDVTAVVPMVDPGRIGGELRIGGSQTDALPIAGRTVTDLALIDSSVRAAPAGNFYGERGSVFVVNGQTGRSNAFLVDGLDNNDQSSGTAMNSFFSQQVIQEFVVLTHQYAPEFGRAAGGVLNIVTHRGGNERIGEILIQGTTDDWNSPGLLVENLGGGAGQRDGPGRFDLGFRLGGPLKKDRAFYFLAFEHQDNDEIVPFTGLARDEVPSIPVTGLGPGDEPPPVQQEMQSVPGNWVLSPENSDNLFLRTDFNLGENQFLMLRLSMDDRNTSDLNVGGRFTPEAGFELEERDIQFAASWTSVISPRVFNELRFLAGSSEFHQFANSSRPGVDRPSGLFGGNNLNRQLRDEDRFQLVENITTKLKNHTLKFGLDVVSSRTTLNARFNPTGNLLYRTDYGFEPGDCGDLYPEDWDNPRAGVSCPGGPGDDDGDGIIDEPAFPFSYPLVYTFIDGEPSAILDDTRFGLFVQDSWQATPKLLLDYGLRYDLSTFTLPSETSVESFIPNGGAERDRDNVSPRLGFTYTPPGGDMVIRGGVGMFHDKLVLAFPAVAGIMSGTEILMAFPQGMALEWTEEGIEQFIAEYGIDLFQEIIRDPNNGVIKFLPSLTMRFSTATELETPYTVQYTLGAEWKLRARSSFSADLIRSTGYHLPLMRDLNPVVAIDKGDGFSDPDFWGEVGVPIHLDDTTGSIAAIVTDGRSWYSGLDLAYRWRGEGAWFSASYTLSKATDTGPDPLKGGVYLPPDSTDVRNEKGSSDFDTRHRMVIAGESPLPWSNMRISVVAQFSSGVPFNITTGLDENLDGINTDRPLGVGRNTGEDTSVEAVNDIRLSEGLEPVASLHEPSFAQVDVRITQPFPVGSRGKRGEAYLQVFNLFNRYNGGQVDGRVTSLYFGRPVGYAGPPRTVELGLKFAF